MSNTALKTVAGVSLATQEKDPSTFPGMLKAFKGEIARALPKHLNADRMCRIALTSFRLTPALAECAPASVFAALIQASQLGLEPGLNGRAYLIPYAGECQFVPGWKGLVELANRTGRASVWTGAVFEGDAFEYQLGDSPYVKHMPGAEDDPAKLTHVYAIGRIKGNDWPVIEVWTAEKVRKHRDRYNRQGKKHYSFREWEMYARKVPLLQVLKYLPASPELETAISLNTTSEMGERQGLTIEGALSGEYVPPTPPAADEADGAGIDHEQGEVAYATVIDAINKADTAELLDMAREMIAGVKDPQHRAELDVEERKRRRELKLS